jgi:hypothetical protein
MELLGTTLAVIIIFYVCLAIFWYAVEGSPTSSAPITASKPINPTFWWGLAGVVGVLALIARVFNF